MPAADCRDQGSYRRMSGNRRPRGSMRGRQVLAAWLGRARFSAESLRWFCGADGSVVVEQAARWIDPASGADRGQARVASCFCV